MKNQIQKENQTINQVSHSEKRILNKGHMIATTNNGNYNIHQYNVVFTPYDIDKSFKISQQKAYDKLQSAKTFLKSKTSNLKATITLQNSITPKQQNIIINNEKLNIQNN